MSRPTLLAAILPLTLAALLGAAGCGGDSTSCGVGTHAEGKTCVPDVACGAGTHAEGAACVPDVACGVGTHAEGAACVPDVTCGVGTLASAGHCVPDGSVVCVQGTRFDLVTGTCVVDATACADGTTLVGSSCIPDDELLQGAAAHLEAAEPNGPGAPSPAGALDAPALGASTTLYGCVTPVPDDAGVLQPDVDTWRVSAAGPMVLEITADGLRGLAAGFAVTVADPAQLPALAAWVRYGLDRTGDTARRQVYLPAAGTYDLQLQDQRPLFDGGATGAADTCYFATVRQVPIPASTTATLPATTGAYDGQVQRFTFTAAADGDILDLAQTSTNPAFTPGLVVLRDGEVRSAARVGTDQAISATVGGLEAGELLTLVVDPELDYGLAPQPFTLELRHLQAPPLPTSGGLLTVTEKNGSPGPAWANIDFAWFDVATAGVKHFDLVASKPIDMVILRRDLFTASGASDPQATIDAFGGGGRAAFQGEFVRFLTPGRYYFATSNPAATVPGGTYTISATISDVPTTPLAFGADSGTTPIPLGSGFHALDLTDPLWVELAVTGTSAWGAGNTVTVQVYDLAQEGWLVPLASNVAGQVPAAFSGSQPAAAPFAPLGRILAGDTRDWLVRVSPSGTPEAGASYSLTVKDRTGFTSLGTITPAAGASLVIPALATTAPARFLAFGATGDTVRVLAQPGATIDVRMVRLNAAEAVIGTANVGAVGAEEQLPALVPAAPASWVAWTVENVSAGVSADVALTVSATSPRPYVITSGALAFVDACAGGTTLVAGGDDQLFAAQGLPAELSAFQLFGEPVPATHRVSANGWISFDTAPVSFGGFASQPIPAVAAPNGVIAPYWQDLDGVTLCRRDDAVAGTVTYQWTGQHYLLPGQTVQFQAVLHAGGALDFVYGPLHLMETDDLVGGRGATIGVENLQGGFGHQILRGQAGVLTGTSYTLTPQ